MINMNDIIMVIILLSVLLALASSRLITLVKVMALQGIMVSLLPLLLQHHSRMGSGGLVSSAVDCHGLAGEIAGLHRGLLRRRADRTSRAAGYFLRLSLHRRICHLLCS